MNRNVLQMLKCIDKNTKKIEKLINFLVKLIKKLIGNQKFGKKRMNLYHVVAGIMYYLRTGCTWRALPTIFGNYKTVYGWYQRICHMNIFSEGWIHITKKLLEEGKISLKHILIDGSLTNFLGGGDYAKKNPRNRNKNTLNRIFAVNGQGIPLGLVLAPGTAHDTNFFLRIIEQILKLYQLPKNFIAHGDKGFDSLKNRCGISKQRGISYIPHRNMGYSSTYEPLYDKIRWKVERSIAWINRYKAVANICIKNIHRIEQMLYLVFCCIISRFSTLKTLHALIRTAS
jgi:transposase